MLAIDLKGIEEDRLELTLEDNIKFKVSLDLEINRNVYERRANSKSIVNDLKRPKRHIITIVDNDSYIKAILNYDKNSFLRAYENYKRTNYITLNFYNLKKNPYKNQVYLNNSYYLTTDKLNNTAVESDYNLLKFLGLSNGVIKNVLKSIYVSKY